MARKKALVIGGLGVIGRRLVSEFCDLDWDVVALSRRSPDFPTRATFIAVDLLDRGEAGRSWRTSTRSTDTRGLEEDTWRIRH
jgi:nucleoside-diphosphate-sugar epimerase